jgi:monovalent cation:H+ antiporter-2, CPA2 family
MEHVSSLGATIVASLALAYAGGVLARSARLPLIVGYLAAGIVLGLFTPGFVADPKAVEQLAEIGVALLLFGVGLHFSIRDLLAVWKIAVPGALIQVASSAALGYGAARIAGLAPTQALIFGACLAVASTVVATRALDERDELPSEAGRIALGWLVMQDLIVVGLLVLLPATPGAVAAIRPGTGLIALKLFEVVAFVAFMLLLGHRLIPPVLAFTARDGSHELFRLAVLVIALGIAYLSTELIGISPALGAFFAGVVIAESDLSHHAAGESVPVQQVFTVLFFVSVGMLFDPTVLARAPFRVAGAAAVVVVGNTLITLVTMLALRAQPRSAADVAAALAQIGEFSFILSALAVAQGLLPLEARNLVLAAALISIVLQPLVFRAADGVGLSLDRRAFLRRWHVTRSPHRASAGRSPELDHHAIVVGHGRVGSVVAAALRSEGAPFIVIEQDLHAAELLRREGLPVIYGDAAWPEVLDAARPERARLLVIAVPGKNAARRILAAARQANPGLDVVVRTHSKEEEDWLAGRSVGLVVMGERHAAREMADYARRHFAGSGGRSENC